MVSNKTALLLVGGFLLSGCASVPSLGFSKAASESSSPISTSSESSSSNLASSSLSGSNGDGSSQTTNGLIPFSDIGNYIARVVDAKALGIKKETRKVASRYHVFGESATDTTQNVLVKTTDSYSSDETSVNSDGTIDVSFIKTVKTETDTATTTVKTIVPGAPKFEADILLSDSTGITVANNAFYEFEVVDDAGTVIVPWEGNSKTDVLSILLAFTPEQEKKYHVVTRCINCSYSFVAIAGDTYDLESEDGKTIFYQGVSDNDEKDSDSIEGTITFVGLIEGVNYHLKETGVVTETTVTQDKIAGQIDKLFVSGDYTFMSFVPLDKQSRPADTDLVYGADGISTYDKTDYYSDDNRQSFVTDNRSGLVYKIEKFKIKSLKNGCILRDGDNLVYEMRINANKELEFYSIFSNSTITVTDCFKDKYGTRYILNDKISEYDSASKTYFYNLGEYTGNWANAGKIGYFLTDNHQAVKIVYQTLYSEMIDDASLMGADGIERRLTKNDSFDIYYPQEGNGVTKEAYRVNDGMVYSFTSCFHDIFTIQSIWALNTFDQGIGSYDLDSANIKLFVKYGILLTLKTNSDGTKSLYEEKDVEKMVHDKALYDKAPTTSSSSSAISPVKSRLLISSVTLDPNGKLVHYGLNGNTYYDYGVEKQNDGTFQAVVYDEGTRTEEQVVVTMQPINR